jgi:putative multicomponent Na+:H+ antiporter subunit B
MDSYVYVIMVLLPLTAAMVVFQVNPYHALLMRGILGAIAVLVYTVLGAPDVALTEALVGTLLAITLYAIAVRSALVFRLGVLSAVIDEPSSNAESSHFNALIYQLKTIFGHRYMQVELVPYGDRADLHQALIAQEVHATCVPAQPSESASADQSPFYHTTIRLPHLYHIMQTELTSSIKELTAISTLGVAPSDQEKAL